MILFFLFLFPASVEGGYRAQAELAWRYIPVERENQDVFTLSTFVEPCYDVVW